MKGQRPVSTNPAHMTSLWGLHPRSPLEATTYNPAPDAEDRLRRLFTLLLEHTAGERQTPPPAEDNLFGNERKGSDGG